MYSVLCIYTRLETIQRLNLHYNTLHWRWTKPHQLSDSAKYPTWLLCHQGPLSQSKHLLVLPGTLTCDDKKITNLPESLEIELLLPLLGMTLHCQRLFVSWLRGVLICSVISTYENLGEGLRHTALPCGASQAKYEDESMAADICTKDYIPAHKSAAWSSQARCTWQFCDHCKI